MKHRANLFFARCSSRCAPLLPAIDEIRDVTRDLARAVALEAIREGHATCSEEELDGRIAATFWEPAYPKA